MTFPSKGSGDTARATMDMKAIGGGASGGGTAEAGTAQAANISGVKWKPKLVAARPRWSSNVETSRARAAQLTSGNPAQLTWNSNTSSTKNIRIIGEIQSKQTPTTSASFTSVSSTKVTYSSNDASDTMNVGKTIVKVVKGSTLRSAPPNPGDKPRIVAVSTNGTFQALPGGAGGMNKAEGMRCLESMSPQIAMPLMVNRMIESVLCEEQRQEQEAASDSTLHDQRERFASTAPNKTQNQDFAAESLECNETLDNLVESSPPSTEMSLPRKRDVRTVTNKLTFSQIQESIIRNNIEESSAVSSVGEEPKKIATGYSQVLASLNPLLALTAAAEAVMTDAKSESDVIKTTGAQLAASSNTAASKFQVINRTPFTQTLRLKPAAAIASNTRPTTTMSHPAKLLLQQSPLSATSSSSLQPQMYSGEEVKEEPIKSDDVKTEDAFKQDFKAASMSPFVKDEFDLKDINCQSYSKTVTSMLEKGIKADFLPSPIAPSNVTKQNDAGVDLTCKEEFGDSEQEGSPSKDSDTPPPTPHSHQNQTGSGASGGRLRDQIETQLTSHLLASAGVLSTYHKQMDREFAQKQVGLQPLPVKSLKTPVKSDGRRGMEPANGSDKKRTPYSRVNAAADVRALPPKKRALMQSSDGVMKPRKALHSSVVTTPRHNDSSSPALKGFKSNFKEAATVAPPVAPATSMSVRESVRLRLKKRAKQQLAQHPDSDADAEGDDVMATNDDNSKHEEEDEDAKSMEAQSSSGSNALKRASPKSRAEEEDDDDDEDEYSECLQSRVIFTTYILTMLFRFSRAKVETTKSRPEIPGTHLERIPVDSWTQEDRQ